MKTFKLPEELQPKEQGQYRFEHPYKVTTDFQGMCQPLNAIYYEIPARALRTEKISSLISTESLKCIYANYNSTASTFELKQARDSLLNDNKPLKCKKINDVLSSIYDEEYDLRQLSERIEHPYSLKRLFSSNLKICQEPNTTPSSQSREPMPNDDMIYMSLWISHERLDELRQNIEQALDKEIRHYTDIPLLDETTNNVSNEKQFRNSIYYLMHTLKHIDSLSDRPDISKPPGILANVFVFCFILCLLAFATQPIVIIPLGIISTVFAISLMYEQLNYKRLKGNIPVEKEIYNALPDNFKNLFKESPLHKGSFLVEKKAP